MNNDIAASWAALRADDTIDMAAALRLGHEATRVGHAGLACEILEAALREYPDVPELRYEYALALNRGGAQRACLEQILTTLGTAGIPDTLAAKALALRGKLHKLAHAMTASRADAQAAANAYRQAYDLHPTNLAGINAATMALLAGDQEASRRLAQELLQRDQPDAETPSHWFLATQGEAHLLTGNTNAARTAYAQAASACPGRYGDLASMRGQLKLMQEACPGAAEIAAALPAPTVVICSGHMIDQPDRAAPRFPASAESAVAEALSAALDDLRPQIAYSSAAAGADILFLEAMQSRGLETNVVLPFAEADFVDTSVRPAGNGWVERFHAVLDQATVVERVTSEPYLGDSELFRYCNDVLYGKAAARCQQLDGRLQGLIVADPDSTAAPGGALDNLQSLQALDVATRLVDLRSLRERSAEGATPAPEPAAAGGGDVGSDKARRSIQAMIFADVTGFSGIDEAVTPRFFVDFMGTMSEALLRRQAAPVLANTWGDAFFLVYDDIDEAAETALWMRDFVRDQDWASLGLPEGISIRIALHAGPVFSTHDRLLGRTNFYGQHVNRTARMEPVTAPGTVSVSEAAACLLIRHQADYRYELLGTVSLAKAYGDERMYALNRREDSFV